MLHHMVPRLFDRQICRNLLCFYLLKIKITIVAILSIACLVIGISLFILQHKNVGVKYVHVLIVTELLLIGGNGTIKMEFCFRHLPL